MISALRNEWEPWRALETRNRKDWEAAIRRTCRDARGDIDLVRFEEQMMAFYASEVERFLDATAEACGGSREDLQYCINSDKVSWREPDASVIQARCFGTINRVNYTRATLPAEMIAFPQTEPEKRQAA